MTLGRDEPGQRSETVRRANLGAIVRELHTRGPLSRSELVARTGLTRSAIRGLIGELAAADFVTEERAQPLGTPGRPSPVVRLNAARAVVLALDIEVDSLAVALVGFGGDELAKIRVDRRRGRSSVSEITRELHRLASLIRARRPADERLIGIGVAVAGVVRRTDGLVSMAPNLGWIDVPLGDRLADAFGDRVPIYVANEADLGALAESRRGAARGADHVLFISGEVGVGGGLIVNGEPFTGVAGYGGEVGHMPVNPAGTACHCGSIGCRETEIGVDRLLRRAGRETEGGRSAFEAVLVDAADGDPIALGALEETGRWLGIGLAGLVNVLDPRLIVLGGQYARLYPFLEEVIEAGLDRHALKAPRQLVRVVPAALGTEAPLLGAAELAFEPLLADPAAWLRPGHAPKLASA